MFAAVNLTIKEYIKNRKLVCKLAIVYMKQSTMRSSLGVLWVYIHDMLYFSAFLFFRILLTGNRAVQGISSLEYLITGLVPWLMIGEVMNVATNTIRNNKVIIQSIKFPIVILPGIETIAIILKRLPTYIFIFIVCIYSGHLKCFSIFLFLYYLIATLILLLAITTFFSAFIAISDDFHQLYLAVMRILFFTLPIMWDFCALQESSYAFLCKFVKLNPLIYLIEGYRDAFVLGNTQSLTYGIYFWVVALTLFGLGCWVQNRLKKFYSDFI